MKTFTDLLNEYECPLNKNGAHVDKTSKKYKKWFEGLEQWKRDEITNFEQEEKRKKEVNRRNSAWKKHHNLLTSFPKNGSGEDCADWFNQLFCKNPNDKILTKQDIKNKATPLEDFKYIHSEEFREDPDFDDFVFCGTLECDKPEVVLDGENAFLVEGHIKLNKPDTAHVELMPRIERLIYKTIGIVYILTCKIDGKEYIYKFGKTDNTMFSRIGSYDCGDGLNRLNGTCSTTNYKVKQTIVCGCPMNLYLLDCSKGNTIKTMGDFVSPETAGPLPTQVEQGLNYHYIKQYGKKAIGNVQTDR